MRRLLVRLALLPSLLASSVPVMWAQAYAVSTFAGAERVREGGSSLDAPLREPAGVAVDAQGNLFVADSLDHRVRRVAPGGLITTVAGNGLAGFSGDAGPATAAALNNPQDLAVDAQGNLYIADSGNRRVRRVSPLGVITTVAGNGLARPANASAGNGDGGPAIGATLDPQGLAVDMQGNLLIADRTNHRVRRVTPTGLIGTLAGTGASGFAGDDGPASQARLNQPTSVAVDPASGTIFIADYGNKRIRRIGTDSVISTFAGSGSSSFQRDGSAATGMDPWSVAVDRRGNVVFADRANHRVRLVNAIRIVNTIAGNGRAAFRGDGGSGSLASLADPVSVAVDERGLAFIADSDNGRVRVVNTEDTIIRTLVGSGVKDGGPATAAYLDLPTGVAANAGGVVAVSDSQNFRVRRILPDGTIDTVAGTGSAGNGPNAVFGTNAPIQSPQGVALDGEGNVVFADTANHAIRRVSAADGTIQVIAGVAGRAGYGGDNGAAIAALLSAPEAVAFDATGTLFIADRGNNRIRRVGLDGIITTVAGTGARPAAGDGGLARLAQLDPHDLAFDADGALLIADRANHRIRRIAPAGTISTVAGTGSAGFSGDGGLATAARLSEPTGVAVDRGLLLVADAGNRRVRAVLPQGVILTVAGTGEPGFSGDGPVAMRVRMEPYRLAVRPGTSGTVLVADANNHRIRLLTPVPSVPLQVAGGNGQSGAPGLALPQALVVRAATGDGAPVVGLPVTFAVAGGTVNPTSAVTGPDGTARTTLTLGSAVGTATVTASAPGFGVATFTATSTTGGGGGNPLPPPAPTSPPVVFAEGVLSAGNSTPIVRAMSRGAIFSLYGERLATPGVRLQASGADLVNGRLPTRLGAVCVRVGGLDAPLFFVSPGQINLQVPNVPAVGTVPLQVVTGCGTLNEMTSATVNVPVQAAAPEFFYFRTSPDGRNPIAAVDPLTSGPLGAPESLGAGFAPARPGQIVTLYATGLGATLPLVSPGELPGFATELSGGKPTVTVGGVRLEAADVLYAGVAPTFAGLYQFNLHLPDSLPDGDLPVVVNVGGRATPVGGFLTVRR